jgi:hypothetical protein
VVRKEGNTVKRGVVFINETIPYPIVAWMANKLYNEHTLWCLQNTKLEEAQQKKVNFEWLLNKNGIVFMLGQVLNSDEE